MANAPVPRWTRGTFWGLHRRNHLAILGVVASVLFGLFAFHYPIHPRLKGKAVSVADVLGLKALSLLKDRSFAVFIACSL